MKKITPLSTGYVCYIDESGELPIVLAYAATEDEATHQAKAAAADLSLDMDEDDLPAPVHVDCHASRYDFDTKDWLLFGQPYSLDGDVVVPHGTLPIKDD